MTYLSSPDNRDRFLRDTQWIYIDEDLKTIFSHAGVSEVWLKESIEPYLVSKIGPQYDDGTIDLDIVLNHINDIESDERFGFTPDSPFDMYGESKTQPLTWIRPGTLAKCMVEGYIQVVGHTPVKLHCTDAYKATKGNQHLWLCDALHNRNYLVIEDGEFKPKGLL